MSLELLEKHPKVAKLIKEWYSQKMIEALDGDDTIVSEFKEYMLNQSIENVNIANGLEAQPRAYFDVFDDNKVYISIEIIKMSDGTVNWQNIISYDDMNDTNIYFWETRKQCETDAITRAFTILEKRL